MYMKISGIAQSKTPMKNRNKYVNDRATDPSRDKAITEKIRIKMPYSSYFNCEDSEPLRFQIGRAHV